MFDEAADIVVVLDHENGFCACGYAIPDLCVHIDRHSVNTTGTRSGLTLHFVLGLGISLGP